MYNYRSRYAHGELPEVGDEKITQYISTTSDIISSILSLNDIPKSDEYNKKLISSFGDPNGKNITS